MLPASAAAQVTSDLVDFNLTESVSTWPTQYHISTSGTGYASYRWLDSPNKATVISANACTDLSFFGSSSYGIGDTTYHNLYLGGAGQCFQVRGRTTAGSGSMVNHDGRIQR
ncbi:hypothetical protein OM076_08435 [Solirubrobacter ginsenosidimutans]|uniref:Uncharacterized protein n=1 Tax=Solirubrobacter ginsenosidimutans TaxID=490573 RepID=A0A9X3S448_9ACTN|nr:hypothetical protein [Solirubrobacter ginsenosidimutans]MDA0160288.1 hypothetical protein [Solirubrobacter ginsenosidimutans]